MRGVFIVLVFCGLCIFGVDIEKVQADRLANYEQLQLLISVRDGDLEGARKAIYHKGISINFTHEGFPALRYAGSNIPMVRLLIDAGADVNAKDKNGFSRLHSAAFDGDIPMARLLIDAGADMNDKKDGVTAIQIAEEKGHSRFVKFLELAGAETESVASTKSFWEGLEDIGKSGGGFKEGWQYGYERGKRGETPWWVWVILLAFVGVFALACWKGAEKRGRNPWIWGGLTLVTILLPLLCWLPYVVLRILGEPKKDKAS